MVSCTIPQTTDMYECVTVTPKGGASLHAAIPIVGVAQRPPYPWDGATAGEPRQGSHTIEQNEHKCQTVLIGCGAYSNYFAVQSLPTT